MKRGQVGGTAEVMVDDHRDQAAFLNIFHEETESLAGPTTALEASVYQ